MKFTPGSITVVVNGSKDAATRAVRNVRPELIVTKVEGLGGLNNAKLATSLGIEAIKQPRGLAIFKISFLEPQWRKASIKGAKRSLTCVATVGEGYNPTRGYFGRAYPARAIHSVKRMCALNETDKLKKLGLPTSLPASKDKWFYEVRSFDLAA